MRKHKSQILGTKKEIDRLLLETLQDDPPAGLGERLDAHWDAFKDKAETDRNRRPARLAKEDFLRWFPPVSRQLLPKGVLAAAAVAMVVWGFLMQAGGSSNVLAKNLNLIKTTVLVKDQVTLAAPFTCRIELSQESGRDREYLVQWLPPDLQRVDMRDREGDLIRTVWIRDQEITVAEHGKDNVYSVEGIGRIDDPYLPVILRLIRPQELAGRLYGEWEETGRELREGCVWSTYRIASIGESRDAFDMTVDLCDYRPKEIRQDLDSAEPPQTAGRTRLHFQFDWDEAIPPERMIPEKKTAPREV